jgi:long-chain fatty acid transport protein
MKIKLQSALKFVAIMTLGCSASLLWAGGSRLPDQDAFATGRGEAFVATADNPSAIFYNPAGISQLEGNNLRAGIYGIYLDPSYKSPVNGQTYDNQFKYHAIPQFFYTYGRTNWPVSFGLGSYSPFGLGVIWPQNIPAGFNSVATEGRLSTETINPVIAIKLSPTLSIGGGVMVNYTKISVQNSILQFNGDGWDVGYNLGLLWQPQEKISFGTTFRSPTTVNFNGHTGVTGLGTSSANAQWPFPLEAVFGVSYRPTPKWNLEFDADYTDWSTVGTVNINQTTPPLSGIVPSIPEQLDWESSWYFEWGATHYFDNGWHVSAGYIFNENSLPDAHYTPLVTDLDKHFLSVGVGHKGKSFDFDVAYQFGYGPTRTVSGATGASAPANGAYAFISHAVSVSAGWHF